MIIVLIIFTLVNIAIAGVTLAGVVNVDRRLDKTDKTLRELPASSSSSEPKTICGCNHSYAVHDDAGVCHGITNGVLTRTPVVLKTGYEGEDHEVHHKETFGQTACNCKRYVGPLPLPSYVA